MGFPNTYLGRPRPALPEPGPGDDGGVTFREVGVDAGLEVVAFEYGLGAVLTDVDRDGDLDLYVANDTNPNRLYDNVPWPGGVEADPAGPRVPLRGARAARPAWPTRSGDGRRGRRRRRRRPPDLFVTNARAQSHAIYRGQPPTWSIPRSWTCGPTSGST